MADVGVGDPGAELDARGPHGRRAETDPHVAHPALIGDPVGVEPQPLTERAQLGDPADRIRAGVVTQEARAESKVRRPRAGRHASRTRLCRALSRCRRMAVHGRLRVADLQGGDDREVLVHRVPEASRRRDHPDLNDALVEHLQHVPEGRVPGGVDDEAMKTHVRPEERLVRLRTHLVPSEVEERALDPGQDLAVDALRSEATGGRLEDLPELPDLEDVGHRELGDDRAPVRVAHRQSFLLELPDRLADRRAAGSQRARDLELVERGPRWEVGRHDPRLQVPVRLLDAVSARELGPSAWTLGHASRGPVARGRRSEGRSHCVFSV